MEKREEYIPTIWKINSIPQAKRMNEHFVNKPFF